MLKWARLKNQPFLEWTKRNKFNEDIVFFSPLEYSFLCLEIKNNKITSSLNCYYMANKPKERGIKTEQKIHTTTIEY